MVNVSWDLMRKGSTPKRYLQRCSFILGSRVFCHFGEAVEQCENEFLDQHHLGRTSATLRRLSRADERIKRISR